MKLLLAMISFLLLGLACARLDSVEEAPLHLRLRQYILEYYDSSVRPVYNKSAPTNITADILLHQIIDVDEKKQFLKTTFWMRLYWQDEFLTWDLDEWEGIDSLLIKPEYLWVPDLCIYNALFPAVYADEMQNFLLLVHHDGSIRWLSPLVVETSCNFNVRYFPFDIQSCSVTIGSWIFGINEIDLFHSSEKGDTSELKYNIEWEVKDYRVQREVVDQFTYPYVVLHLNLALKRKPGFYITYLYIPPVVIIFSSLYAFCLPPGSDAKVDLAVIGLLSQTVFLLIISDLMPPDTENPPVLGQCLTMLLIVQSTAVILVVIVKRAHDDSIHKKSLPGKRLLTLMHFLRYPFCLWQIDYRNKRNHVSQRCTETVSESIQLAEIGSDSCSEDTTLEIAMAQLLNEIRVKNKVKKESNEIVEQWKNIAAMYDRILFVIFTLIIFAITIWFLNMAPTSEYDFYEEQN